MYAPMYGYGHMNSGTHRDRKRAPDSLDLELQAFVRCLTQRALGTKLWS